MKKYIAMLLCALLVLSGAVLAETALDLYDLRLTAGGNTYAFPMTVEACKAAGLNIPDLGTLEDGQYYPSVPVDDGCIAFKLRVECINGEMWATGYNIYVDEAPDAVVGGIAISDIPALGETNAALSARSNVDDVHLSYDNISAYTLGNNYVWNLYFESDAASAAIDHVNVSTQVPSHYATAFDGQAGVQDANLPDAAAMDYYSFILDGKYYPQGSTVQDLLDDGWVIENRMAPDTMIEKCGATWASGDRATLCNGAGLVKVYAFNFDQTADVPFSQCVINEVIVNDSYNTSLILANGLQKGCTLADCEKALGAPVSQEPALYGEGTTYSFTKLDEMVQYEITIHNDLVADILVTDLV